MKGMGTALSLIDADFQIRNEEWNRCVGTKSNPNVVCKDRGTAFFEKKIAGRMVRYRAPFFATYVFGRPKLIR
jgi:hypothetical protein